MGGVTASSLSESSKYPLQTDIATKEINQIKEFIADVSEMKATLSSYGMTKLSTATDVTDINAYALSATEKNKNITGTIGHTIEVLKTRTVPFISINNSTTVSDIRNKIGPNNPIYLATWGGEGIPAGGGMCIALGYLYPNANYGAQLVLGCDIPGSIYVRHMRESNWGPWYTIATNILT